MPNLKSVECRALNDGFTALNSVAAMSKTDRFRPPGRHKTWRGSSVRSDHRAAAGSAEPNPQLPWIGKRTRRQSNRVGYSLKSAH